MNSALAPSWVPHYLVPFVTLSYPTETPADPDSFPHSSYYGTGYLDICIIISFIAVMAVLRDVARLCVLEPFARWRLTQNLKNSKRKQAALQRKGEAAGSNGSANGHASSTQDPFQLTKSEERKMQRSVLRFAEQGWAFIYYTIQFSFGVVSVNLFSQFGNFVDLCQYVHYNIPTKLLDPVDAWARYPHFPLPAPIKFYYLNETAFYLHGIFILNAEARRKDHVQMMTHHVVAVALMFLSYAWNYTRIGCLIMVLMDFCDLILPVR
jgi:acyl-CoA-dependent ceramide synthase